MLASAQHRSFYVSLLSDSNRDSHPNNTPSTFTVVLPKTVVLNGDWEVALAQYSIPSQVNHSPIGGIIRFCAVPVAEEDFDAITSEQNVNYAAPSKEVSPSTPPHPDEQRFVSKGGRELCHEHVIPPNAKIKTASDLIRYINKHFKSFKKRAIYSNKTSYKAPFFISSVGLGVQMILRDLNTSVSLDHTLGRILGFPLEAGQWVGFRYAGEYNFEHQTPKLEHNNLHSLMVLYADVVEPQIVANTQAPLLKTIPITEPIKGHHLIAADVINRQYMPVCSSAFQTISINLRDTTGQLLKIDWGLVHLRLHFRPYVA